MDEDPEYWEKYSWNNLFYYRSLSPSRHFRYSCPDTLYRINNSDYVKRCQTKILKTNFCLRYHALISVIWMFLGVLILASKTFHLISIEPIACGFLLLCCSIFAVRRLTAHRETTSTCGFLVLPQVSKGDHHCFCSWSRHRFFLPNSHLFFSNKAVNFLS